MKQNLKNEVDVLSLIQAQLTELNKKIDSLINRPLQEARPSSRPFGSRAPSSERFNDHNKGRMVYKAICTDCKKECGIPFRPSGDRPVYCQDCFSKRKVINLSGFKAAGNDRQEEGFTAAPKKTFGKKKPVGKKKVFVKNKKK